MKSRWRYLSTIITCVFLFCLPAFAGEDVELFNSAGQKLAPSQIGDVNYKKTCGDCHEVDEKAASVHFNRGSDNVDAQYGDCLSCHLPVKNAYNAQGNITKTTAVPADSQCVACHTELEQWAKSRTHTAHAKMSCYDCHKGAGHEDIKLPSCTGCHLGKGKSSAPHPAHAGFTMWHIKNIACETCHIVQVPGTTARPGYGSEKGEIIALSEGAPVYHNVAEPDKALGADGCDDCHGFGSRFFFGKTQTTNKQGNAVTLVNYKSMDLNKDEVILGIWRESVLKTYGGWLFPFMFGLSIAHYAIFGPKRVHTVEGEPMIQRFTLLERLIHVTAVVSFLFLATTGIMLMLRVESPASPLRSMHGHVGPLFALAVIGMLIVWWKNGLFVSCDKDWVCNLGGYLWIKGDCPAEKFNAGQKVFYWLLVIACGLLVSITGFWLIVGRGNAPSWTFTLHDLAGISMIAGIIGHVYLSVFANPGTIAGVITGRVRRSWAAHHHSDWLRRHEND